ncbi:MAG: ATP-binding protein [Methylococcaceae bacterium]
MINVTQQALEQALEQALQVCAAEPIHQIGNIQPHGATLVLSPDNLHTVLQVSANINDFIDLKTKEVLGKSLEKLLGKAFAQQIERLIKCSQAHQTATGLVTLSRQQMPVEYEAYIYSANEFLVLELCKDSGLPPRAQLGDLLMHIQESLMAIESGTEITAYFEQIAGLVQALTGYDSVMIYRFEANWDGEVIAQSRIEAATSYLGLHFPASDIPAQARALYVKNRVRIVTDVNDKPVPIVPTLNPVNEQPLDMTYSALRSLSPIHLEYLRNMGVQASMVISLLQNGRLWGLISCHHLTPKQVSFTTREAALFISRMASIELTSIEIKAERNLLGRASQIKTAFLKAITTQSETDVLQNVSPNLLDSVDISGLIVVVEGKHYLQGLVPEPAAIDALLDWLAKQSITDIFSCDHLSEKFPPASAYKEIVSGIIATTLTSDMRNCLVWLRKENMRTVKWAGSYEKGLVQTPEGGYSLNPRNSFESWSALEHGHNTPWSALEINIIKAFGRTLSEGLLQKHKTRLAENERLEALERLHKIANWLPGVAYQFRLLPDGSVNFPYISDGLWDIYRLRPADVCKDAFKVFSLVHPDDYDAMWLSIHQSAQNMSLWNHEYRARCKDGTVHWLYGNALPELEANGSILWHGFVSDITERRHMDQALLKKNVDLEKAKISAEKANLAKSEFLSSMSHELRSPLNAILGFAQLLESDISTPTTSQAESITQIVEAGWHLLTLINEILDLAKIESGQTSLSQESLSLNDIIVECCTMLEPKAQKFGIRTIIPPIDAQYLVYADRIRLKQVLINLLSNAIKYNSQQGTVEVQCTENTPGYIRVSIKDTGAGLSPEQLTQLFQSFNRLGQESGNKEGTGIGLMVAKQLIELMGGVIGVDSRVGTGSVFWFEFPLMIEPHPDLEAGVVKALPNPQKALEAPRQTLLYVEDNPANMKLVEQIIARHPNLHLLTAVDATSGIQMARDYQPEVILMDINLPDTNGIEALHILRSDPSTAHLTVIALSANAMPRDIENALKAGFFSYITKPINVKEFMATLNSALAFANETNHDRQSEGDL